MKSERLVQAEEMLENMQSEEIEFGKWFVQQLKNLKHILLFFPSINSVITGDAPVHENDELVIANRHFCITL
ncbi:hypothetical protein [Paenibacillus endoradicis]|uniref:hypothetical protein n=1 Tax=Paenibacillus endoradicis TaxID=2972487 RepID=UPI00358FC66F